jgi:hypothetical protein
MPLVAYLQRADLLPTLAAGVMLLAGCAAILVGVHLLFPSATWRPRWTHVTWWVIMGTVGGIILLYDWVAPRLAPTEIMGVDRARAMFALVGAVALLGFVMLVRSVLADRAGGVLVQGCAGGEPVSEQEGPARDAVEPRPGPDTAEVAQGPAGFWDRLHEQALRIILFSAAVAMFALFVLYMNSGGRGEPWDLSGGISALPSELIRLGAVVAGLYFGWRCLRVQRSLPGKAACSELLDADTIHTLERGAAPERWEDRFSVGSWRYPYTLRPDGQKRVCAGDLLVQLRDRCAAWPRLARLAGYGMLFASVVVGAIGIFDIPDVPIRGVPIYATHLLLMWLLAITLNFTSLAMLDTIVLCTRYVDHLGAAPTEWPPEIVQAAERTTGVVRADVGPWLDVQSVAQLTRSVNAMIYYPVILVLLSAAAWYRGIDAWTFSPVLAVIYGLSLVVCVVSAYVLRRSAERMREAKIEAIERDRARLDDEIRDAVLAWDEIARGAGGEQDRPEPVEVRFGFNRYIEGVRVRRRDGSWAPDGSQFIPELAGMIAAYAAEPVQSGPEGTALARSPQGAAGAPLHEGTVYLTLRQLREPEHRPVLESMTAAARASSRHAKLAAALKARSDELRLLADEIRNIKKGAFAPWSQDPVFRGVAVPIIGFASLKFAEWINAAVQMS